MLKKLLGIDEVIREIKKNRDKIPKEVAEELKEVQEVTSKPISRKILKVIEDKGGRVNVTQLRNYCKTNSICSRNTFYNYMDKLEQKGVIQRVREGRKKYVRTTSKPFIDI